MTNTSLTIISGAQPKRYILNADIITIGNGPGNTINLPVESIAQTHCRLRRANNNNYILEDNYNNGNIYVNSVKISAQPLTSGDMIQLGTVILKFEVSASVSEVKTPLITHTATPMQKPPASGMAQPPAQRLGQASVPDRPPDRLTPVIRAGTPSRPPLAGGQSAPSSPIIPKPRNIPPAPLKSAAPKIGTAPKRRITPAKPAAVKGTQKQIKILIISAIVIVVIVLGFVFLKAPSGPSQEELSKDLQKVAQDVDSLLKDKQSIEAEKLLIDTISNTKYANALQLGDIKKIYNQVHDVAELERQADKEVAQFKETLDKAISTGEIKQKAEILNDACQTLIGKYAGTAQETLLSQLKEKIQEFVANTQTDKGNWIDDFDKAKKNAEELLNNNKYSEAITLLNDLVKKYDNDLLLTQKVQIELDAINEKARAECTQIKDKVKGLKKDGKTADAATLIGEVIERFKGTDCYKDLEQLQPK